MLVPSAALTTADPYSDKPVTPGYSDNRGGSYGGSPQPSPQRAAYDSPSSSQAYKDSRPRQSKPEPTNAGGFADLSDSDEEDDDIPESVIQAAARAGRPRAPSGGAPPSSQVAQAAPAVDLLGLSSAPSSSMPADDLFGSAQPQQQQQQQQQQDFLSAQQPQQQQPAQQQDLFGGTCSLCLV